MIISLALAFGISFLLLSFYMKQFNFINFLLMSSVFMLLFTYLEILPVYFIAIAVSIIVISIYLVFRREVLRK